MERDKLKKDLAKKPTGIFYLDGNRGFFFEQAMGSPVALDFTPDVISNLEVIDRKKLDLLIHAFIKNYKLQPKNIAIMLSTRMTFDKEFPHGSIEIEKNIEEFLELVPFEDVLSKRVILSGKTKVSAANREICESIKASFVNAGFIVSGIYPLSLCIDALPELSSNMDLNLIVNKLPILKDFNMQPIVEASSVATEKEKPNKTRLILLVSVFAFLILVLLVVFYKNIIAPSSKTTNVLPTPAITPIQNIPAPVVETTTPENSTESAQNSIIENPSITPVANEQTLN
jgi:hypothetical protein